MKFVEYSEDNFFGKVNGILIDDAYDERKLYQYKNYIETNKINYIISQDNDISYLKYAPNVEYIVLPADVENLNSLYLLKNLKGLKIFSRSLHEINFNMLPKLKYISIYDNIELKNFNCINHIENIELLYFTFKNITNLSFHNLKKLSLSGINSLLSLEGIEKFCYLEELNVNYCLKLRNIDSLIKLPNLCILNIVDANKIEDRISIIRQLNKLKKLSLYTLETNIINKLENLEFIDELRDLIYFKTDYKIVDGNLKSLLRLEEVVLFRWSKNYNLKDIDLPHKIVLHKKFGWVNFNELSDDEKSHIEWHDCFKF